MSRTTRRTMLFAAISFAALSTTAQAAILVPTGLTQGQPYSSGFCNVHFKKRNLKQYFGLQ